MAKRVTALSTYRPRIKRGPIVEPPELAGAVARRTRLSPADVIYAASSIGDEALYLLRTGRSVRLPGLGMLTPSLDMEGTLNVRFVLDRTALRRASHGDKVFLGEMTHPEHRHKRPEDLVALWDAEHPDDPVED